jgi:hypothetical protein
MLLYIQIRTKDNKIPKEKIMKLEIRNIEEIRNLNYRKGNNEIYFLETELDEKKEKFKIADAVFEDNNLIYRFVENEKTKEHVENLKTYLKINKYLEHETIATKKEVLNIITSEEGKTIEKTFAEREAQKYTRYLETSNIQSFVSIIEGVSDFDGIKNTEFVSETGKIRILFEDRKIPECVIAEDFKLKRSKRIQDISENGKETYSESIEHNVLCTSLEAGSEIYRMLWNFGYEVSEIERKLLGRALLKLLPENNLTEKRELDGWERLVFDQPVKLNAEMLKTAMLVFNYAETVEHKEALNIVREAVEKNITNFPFFSDEAKITLGNEIKFEFNTINKMATMAEKVKEIWGIAKIEEFAAVSMNGIHFKKENETLIVAKENFAKTDFRTLKNLSEIIGIPIECIIRKKYDFFFITGNELKIKVSAWRYEKEKDMIVEEYKCLEEIFEKVSIEKGI